MIFPPAEMTSDGASSMARTSAGSQSGSGIASLLMKMTLRAAERTSPAAMPPVKPRFSGSGTKRTVGKRVVIAAIDPSVEPLSTTVTIAPSTSGNCGISASRHATVSSRLFQLTMMTSTGGALRNCLRCGV